MQRFHVGAASRDLPGINALIRTIAALNLSAQFAEAWGKIFAGQITTVDPHRDPSKPPTIGGINGGNNVASVVFLPTGGNGENNPQTDAGHRMRITATGGGPIGAGLDVATITFATPYRYRRADGTIATMQPHVHCQATSPKPVYAVVSSNGYTLTLGDQVSASTSIDVSVIVEPGLPRCSVRAKELAQCVTLSVFSWLLWLAVSIRVRHRFAVVKRSPDAPTA